MPVNAGFEYFNAEKKYHEATSTEAKLQALYEMLRTAPSHKSSENLRRELTKKIAKLKKEIEKEKKVSSKKGSAPTLNVKKEGAAQVAIIGFPNSGKSTLLSKLSGVKTEIAPYPFTTKKPVSAMMNYKGALVQLVEMPAIIEGSSNGKANGTQVLSAIRNSDALLVLFRTEQEKKTVTKELENSGIIVNRKKPQIVIKTGEFSGISISGTKNLKAKPQEVVSTLKAFGVYNASVFFAEPSTIEGLVEALNERLVYKKAIFFDPFSGEKDTESLKKKIFELTGKIIVYTKRPGTEVDYREPLVLEKGSTVEDCAKRLHKDLAKNLKFVRVWGSSKFSGQRVSKNYRLSNEDIIEINA